MVGFSLFDLCLQNNYQLRLCNVVMYYVLFYVIEVIIGTW